MTHLFKTGYAPDYKARTECGLIVGTKQISPRPTCNTCATIDAERELKDLNAVLEVLHHDRPEA